MILGQSAATGAVLALNSNGAVQDVPYPQLRERLLKDGQVLEYASRRANQTDKGSRFIDPTTLPGIIVDDDAARLTGKWQTSSASSNFIGSSYSHDGAAKDGRAKARYEPKLPGEGRYEVLISWPPHSNRSSKVSVEINSADARKVVTIDQRKLPADDGQFHSLGVFNFTANQPAAVVVSNAEADGYVVIDAVQWVKR